MGPRVDDTVGPHFNVARSQGSSEGHSVEGFVLKVIKGVR